MAPLRCVLKRNRSLRGGFTLVETMLALMILVLVSAIVAMGVPVAFETYTKAVNGSNAQMLLSTTATELRDELGFARAVWTSNGYNKDGVVQYYLSEEGYWAKLNRPVDGGDGVISKGKYIGDLNPGGNPSSDLTLAKDDKGNDAVYDLATVSTSGTAEKNTLNITFDEIRYADGVFEVRDLKVYTSDSSDSLASCEEYDVASLVLGSE